MIRKIAIGIKIRIILSVSEMSKALEYRICCKDLILIFISLELRIKFYFNCVIPENYLVSE